MTRKTHFFLIFLFFSHFAFARGNWNFSIEPSFGLKNGRVDEYMYLKNCVYSNDKLSELNWDLKNELFAKLKLDGGWKFLFHQLSFSVGIPGSSGKMCDSDWANRAYNNLPLLQYKTNYSESKNKLCMDFSADIKVGASFEVLKLLKVKPSVGFEFSCIKFSAKGGTCFYGNSIGKKSYTSVGPWNYYCDPRACSVYVLSGEVVSYERQLYNCWLGSQFEIPIASLFTVYTGGYVSPFLHTFSIDKHKKTDYKYAESGTAYFSAFKVESGVGVKINEKNTVLFNCDFFYMPVIRESSLYTTIDSSSFYTNYISESGAGARFYDFSVSWKIKVL